MCFVVCFDDCCFGLHYIAPQDCYITRTMTKSINGQDADHMIGFGPRFFLEVCVVWLCNSQMTCTHYSVQFGKKDLLLSYFQLVDEPVDAGLLAEVEVRLISMTLSLSFGVDLPIL
jgi:hypothetical protein